MLAVFQRYDPLHSSLFSQIQDLTSDVDDFVNVLLDMTNDTTDCDSCDLTSLFDVM